jgi:hypothetical protein
VSREPARRKLDMWPVTVWCAATKGQLRKAAKTFDLELPANHAGCTWSITGPHGFQIVVYVDAKGHDMPGLADTCAHEASHVADRVFEYVEEERPGTETRAYLVGGLTRWLLGHCAPKSFGD